mgnify:CR=1 FL=1
MVGIKNQKILVRASLMNEERGSFRDPAGNIFYKAERIFRKINKEGQDRLEYLIQNNIIEESINKKYLIKSKK